MIYKHWSNVVCTQLMEKKVSVIWKAQKALQCQSVVDRPLLSFDALSSHGGAISSPTFDICMWL